MMNGTCMKAKLIIFLIFFASNVTYAQSEHWFSNNPWEAKFVVEDVERFWQAFDAMEAEGVSGFERYIESGTPGLKDFVPYRIISADSIFSKAHKHKAEYLKSKDVLNDLPSKEKRIKAIYAAMKYWLPEAKFPPVYFVVGRFNSGGTVSDAGIILGTEMQENLDGLPALVAHELIHFQQKNEFEKWDLLAQSITEGSADFIGELISGETVDSLAYYQYGRAHIAELKIEFIDLMDGKELDDWMYGTTGKDNRPNDLGYWMGYEIVKAYFDKQPDKQQAIYDILNFSDQYQFLLDSEFLNNEIEQAALRQNQTVEEFINALAEPK